MFFFLVCRFLKQTDVPDPLASPDVVDIAVHRSELFCLHGNGQMSHLSLVSAERCVERLLRRDSWVLAASVCCMFPHALVPSRVRQRARPVDRLIPLERQRRPLNVFYKVHCIMTRVNQSVQLG